MEERLSKSPNAKHKHKHKHKVVVIMGATGSGKSRLAIDLAQHFPAEILNADCMQVYEGLDIVTNKVPVEERKGVIHHLLGTVSSKVNFTSSDFRDTAIPIIDSIISRKHLPIIVGGSNSYIQALVSTVDDVMKNGDDDLKTSERPFGICINAGSVNDLHKRCDNDVQNTSNQFDQVEDIDLITTNGLHPIDFSKGSADDLHERCNDDVQNTSNKFDLIATNGVHPTDFSKGQKGDTADSFRYDCCFLWLDASLPVLDKFVEDRVDLMIEAGLLEEVSAFYDPKANYKHGLWQAIGLREFEEFFNAFPPSSKLHLFSGREVTSYGSSAGSLANYLLQTLSSSEAKGQEIEKLDKGSHKILLDAAIERMKINTCQLVRKQKQRISRLKTFSGWNLHQLDSTKALETSGSESLEHWEMMVVNISMDVVKRFLSERACETSLKENVESRGDSMHPEQVQDLWIHSCEDRLAEIKCFREHMNGRNINLVVHIEGKFCDLKKFTDSKNDLQD